MKRIFCLGCLMVLAACGNTGGWTRSGSTPQLVAQDFADCQSQGREATQRDTNIMTDILATRGADWQRNGTMDVHMQSFTPSEATKADQVVTECMIGKGYVPGTD